MTKPKVWRSCVTERSLCWRIYGSFHRFSFKILPISSQNKSVVLVFSEIRHQTLWCQMNRKFHAVAKLWWFPNSHTDANTRICFTKNPEEKKSTTKRLITLNFGPFRMQHPLKIARWRNECWIDWSLLSQTILNTFTVGYWICLYFCAKWKYRFQILFISMGWFWALECLPMHWLLVSSINNAIDKHYRYLSSSDNV